MRERYPMEDPLSNLIKTMKEKVFNAILSIAVVGLGALILLAETSLLIHHGVTPEMALIGSLYTGSLGWIILAAVLTTTDWFYDHVTSKIIKK